MRYEPTGLWVEFPFPAGEKVKTATQETTQETTQEAAQETARERIITLLKENPTLTRKQLAVRIGLTPDGVKYHLDRLTRNGRIRHVGPTKKGSWEVLNDAGE